MTTYTQYAARTGRILHQLTLPDWDLEGFDLHHSLLFAGEVNPETHYIVEGVPAERPAMEITVGKSTILANGGDTSEITGIPEGAKLTITGPISLEPVVVDEGAIQFSADVAGDYTIRLECFPYLDWSGVVHAD